MGMEGAPESPPAEKVEKPADKEKRAEGLEGKVIALTKEVEYLLRGKDVSYQKTIESIENKLRKLEADAENTYHDAKGFENSQLNQWLKVGRFLVDGASVALIGAGYASGNPGLMVGGFVAEAFNLASRAEGSERRELIKKFEDFANEGRRLTEEHLVERGAEKVEDHGGERLEVMPGQIEKARKEMNADLARGESSDDDEDDDDDDIVGPASPTNPMNPFNPASPLHPPQG